MVIHDISLPISEALVVWPGDPAIHITQPSHLDKGDKATVSRLDMGAHTGTHVDAPCHFIRGGLGIDSLDLNTLVGPALVVEAPRKRQPVRGLVERTRHFSRHQTRALPHSELGAVVTRGT